MMNYAKDKPKCRECRFWNEDKGACNLDKDRCYYLLEDPKGQYPCEECPYGRGRNFCFPCWKKLLSEKKAEKEVKQNG